MRETDDRDRAAGSEGPSLPVVARRLPTWSGLGAPARRQLLLALALLLAYGFFRQGTGWNENSRVDLVRAMVEGGTTRIDAYHENTQDKSLRDGHYYSDKAPGTALIGVPVYLLLMATYGVAGAGPPEPPDIAGALAFVESGLFTVMLVVLLLRFLRPRVGEPWALVMSLGFALGSLAFPFATMFFGHAAAAFFLFATFYQLWRWRTDDRAWRPLLAGVLAGLAVLTELPLVLGVAVLAGYAVWIGRRRAMWFVLGGVPLLLVLMAYDWLAFGSPVSIGYQYSTLFAEQNQQGIVSVVWPTWQRAGLILYGPRGLVTYAPWIAFAPLGILALRRRDLRAEVAVSLAICAAFLVYNSGAINPLGGSTPGPRYLLPALPFATILVAFVPRILRPIVAFLIAISVVIFFVATVTEPSASARFVDPLSELWIPRLLSADLAPTIVGLRWGVDGAAALVGLLAAGAATAIVVASTFRWTRMTDRWTVVVAGALLVMVCAFALPFVP